MTHEEQRKRLWCDAYIAAMGHPTPRDAVDRADSALEHFDKRFPDPNTVEQDYMQRAQREAWSMDASPKDGSHCWVVCKVSGKLVIFPAKADDCGAANGWSNGDTWEDHDRTVVAWRRMVVPEIPPDLL